MDLPILWSAECIGFRRIKKPNPYMTWNFFDYEHPIAAPGMEPGNFWLVCNSVTLEPDIIIIVIIIIIIIIDIFMKLTVGLASIC